MVEMKRIAIILTCLVAMGFGTSLAFGQTPVLDKFLFMPAVEVPAVETPSPMATTTIAATATPTSVPTEAATTATNTPQPTNTPTTAPTATQPAPVGGNVVCTTNGASQLCAWVSSARPNKSEDITVYGRLIIGGVPQAGQAMQTTWHYKTTTPTCEGVTGPDGLANCTRDISRATSAFQVEVDVMMGGQSVTTSFTPN